MYFYKRLKTTKFNLQKNIIIKIYPNSKLNFLKLINIIQCKNGTKGYTKTKK